ARRVRVRGMQRHNEKVERAGPGNRVAANLGGVEKSDLARGDVLAAIGALRATRRVDARLRVLASAPQPVRHGALLQLHSGTRSARRVRVRGMQRHNEKVERAGPGNRVAANLGGVEKSDLARGDVLAAIGALRATRRVDARLRVLASAPQPVRHGALLQLHSGTAEAPARVIVLEGDQVAPGHEAWVQLYLERPIAAADQDRFVLRVPSPPATVAGGTFVDVAPRRHQRQDSAVRQSLERRATGDVLAEELRKYPRGVTVAALLKATTAVHADVDRLHARRVGDWIF